MIENSQAVQSIKSSLTGTQYPCDSPSNSTNKYKGTKMEVRHTMIFEISGTSYILINIEKKSISHQLLVSTLVILHETIMLV